jgi:hypothetical protein
MMIEWNLNAFQIDYSCTPGGTRFIGRPKLRWKDRTIFYFFFFFFSFFGWGETESTWYVGHCWPIIPAPDDR